MPSPRLRVLAWPAFRGRDVQPYNHLLYTALQERGVEVGELTIRGLVRGDADVVHVHWPEYRIMGPLRVVLWRATAFLAGLAWARWRGTAVVWTVHNLQPHHPRYPSQLVANVYWRLFPRLVDGFIALTEAGVPDIEDRFPALRRRPRRVVPLGHYAAEYPNEVSASEARLRLGIDPDAAVYLFFGNIRGYKDVPSLVRAFREVAGDDRRLVIAGDVHPPDLGEEIAALAAGDDRIALEFRFVANDEIQVFLAAADLVVLPSPRVFNSATVLLVLSFHRPILVPATPPFAEIARQVGGRWVQTFEGRLDGDALEKAMQDRPTEGEVDLSRFEWSTIAEETLRAYEAARPAGRRRR